ncbi:glycosyltransferase family 2 protein [Patescibacteria group bacterium]|nr:glycosyltransferase family 2 protein [Patescibacteria group bacterium]
MLSIVVPAFNEEESLQAFYKELVKSVLKLTSDFEVIFVDDGSSDNSLKILRELEKKDKRVKIYSFQKNQGKAEALTLGFQKAKGEYIVTLDADLQDRPEEIGKLLDKAKEGYDLVSGWREKRKDSKLFINLPSKLFNYLSGLFWGLKLHDYNCGLKVYKAQAAKSLNLYGGMQRFIPLLLHQNGFKVTEIPVIHEKRKFGKSKYGFSKSFKEFPDMFTMLFLSRYKSRPMHFFGLIGITLSLIGAAILLYLSVIHFFGERIGDRPLLVFGVLFVISGFQVLFTGFLADLILHFSKQDSYNPPLLKFETK